jgi:flagellar biosynthesis protein FlhA
MEEVAKFQGISSIVGKVFKHTDILLALALIGILLVLLFPVHVIFMDILFAVSITISVLILMTVVFIEKPLDFNVFPTILLVTAILRLSLNIASTRLILANGHLGQAAAGNVIDAFGNFVMEGNLVIGLIVFGIITIINFVVITKGSGRIAEVAARFSLDAMPGKQMAIDADLSAGLIEEKEAKTRRKELEDESTFYGSMDGANKFVRGDAIAGLLITLINLIGGIIIGIMQKDLSFKDALHTYSALTVGDGLASQVPALIVSLSAGLLVSKSGVSGSVDKAIFGQIGRYPKAVALAALLVIFMGFMPGMPGTIFISLGLATGGLAWGITRASKSKEQATERSQLEEEQKAVAEKEESISDALHIDNIKLELGYNLLSLINYQKGNKLTDQIKALRKQIAKDLGFVIPSVRIHDNMQLSTNSYVVRIKNIECGRGELQPDKLLVMDPAGGEITIPGDNTTEPAFGLPALWIEEKFREEAAFKNYTVVDPPTVITTHITEIIKENITELLSYSEAQKLLDHVDDEHKKLISDVVPDQITVGGLQRVLQALLTESVSIRDLPLIIEAISEVVQATKSPIMITEHVRTRLARQISHENTSDDGYIPVLVLSPNWEQTLSESLVDVGAEEKQISMEPSKLQEFMNALKDKVDALASGGSMPVLLVGPVVRPYVRSIVERFMPQLVVLSQNEIHIKAKIKTLGQV